MQSYFGTDGTTINASLSVYAFCSGLFPLIWAIFADKFGKRPMYIISFLIAIIGMVHCAVSVNVTTFIVFRTVSAVGASSVSKSNPSYVSRISQRNDDDRCFLWVLAPLVILQMQVNEEEHLLYIKWDL